jgi:predicted neutral ceramidase superfamily lipid hydrolase
MTFMRRPWLFTAWCSTTATAYLLCPTNPTVTAYSYTLTSSNLCAVLTILSVPAKPRYPKTDPRDTSNMNNSTQSTFVLLLYSFVVFNSIRYWRRVPYGGEVGCFVWITHRGPLL